MKKTNFQKKNVIIEEELNGIDIDGIGNLEDWNRLVLIDEKCGNFIVVSDGGKLTRNINQKKKSDETLTKRRIRRFTITYRCALIEKCCRREYFFSNHVKYLL